MNATLNLELGPVVGPMTTVKLRYAIGGRPLGSPIQFLAELDRSHLGSPAGDPRAWGERLTRALFFTGAEDATRAWAMLCQALWDANKHSWPLVVWVAVESTSPLAGLNWELLADLQTPRAPRLLGDLPYVAILRAVEPAVWRWPLEPGAPPPAAPALLVANPSYLQGQDLPPFDEAAARERLRHSGLPLPTSERVGPGEATLTALRELLEGAETNLIYLLCHGTRLGADMPNLWLEPCDLSAPPSPSSDNPAHVMARVNRRKNPIPGEKLLELVKRLEPRRPIALLLSVCHSADFSDGQGEPSLAAALCENGLATVTAMAGSITQDTEASFSSQLLKSLALHGELTRALAEARASIAGRTDAWRVQCFAQPGRIPRWAPTASVSTESTEDPIAAEFQRTLVEAAAGRPPNAADGRAADLAVELRAVGREVPAREATLLSTRLRDWAPITSLSGLKDALQAGPSRLGPLLWALGQAADPEPRRLTLLAALLLGARRSEVPAGLHQSLIQVATSTAIDDLGVREAGPVLIALAGGPTSWAQASLGFATAGESLPQGVVPVGQRLYWIRGPDGPEGIATGMVIPLAEGRPEELHPPQLFIRLPTCFDSRGVDARPGHLSVYGLGIFLRAEFDFERRGDGELVVQSVAPRGVP